MITSLQLENYQSHEDSMFEFDPGVNVIIGRSDSGKTASIRGLYWVCFNRPAGDAFRSSWAKKVRATIVVDGHEVVREKTASKNLYFLDGKEAKAFKTDVPEDIAKLLNLNAINWQTQMDPPFLLSETSGEVARRLNEIVNLEVIDRAMSELESRRRSANADVRSGEADVERLQADLEGFEDLGAMDKGVARVEALEDALIDLREQSRVLRRILERVEQIRKNAKAARMLYKASEQVEDALGLIEDLDEREALRGDCEGVMEDLGDTRERSEGAKALVGAGKALKKVEDLDGQIGELKGDHVALVVLLREIDRTAVAREDLGDRFGELEEELRSITPDVCPLCGLKKR